MTGLLWLDLVILGCVAYTFIDLMLIVKGIKSR